MNYNKIFVVIIILTIICAFLVYIQTTNISHASDILQSNKYVAIELDIQNTGIIIEGSNPVPPNTIAPEIFVYNTTIAKYFNKSGWFPSNYPEMNDSLKILLGTYYIESSPATLKSNLSVVGIYNLPFNGNASIKFLNVYKNGTTQIVYENDSIFLSPGDTWVSPIVTTMNQTYNDTFTGINYSYTVKYSMTYKATNLGLFEKY